MSSLSIRAAMWFAIALAVSAIGFSAWRWAYQSGRDSRQPEFDRINLTLLTLQASIKAANATATQMAQEAAQAARTIEDEQRRRIEETEALVASYEAAAALGADERERRLRAALETRACRRDAANRARVSEAAAIESRSAEAAGLVVESTARNLRGYGEGVERLNGQFTICYRVTSNGEKLTRR